MADTNHHSAQQDEQTPLLGSSNGSASNPPSKGKRFTQWFSKNAWLTNGLEVPIFISLLLTAVIVILCVFYGMYRANRVVPAKTCNTPACVHAASELLYQINSDYKNIDPCTDFHALACGGFAERHDMRPDQGSVFTGTIMGETSQMLLRHILEAPYPEDSEHSYFSPAQLPNSLASADEQNFNKLKTAYDACMDRDKIKKDGVKPLLEIIKQITDMFPVNKRHTDEGDLGYTIGYLAKLGVTAFVSLGASADDKDPDVVVVQVTTPDSIGLPAKDYYEDTNIVKKYEETLVQVVNATHPSNAIRNIAHNVVELEKKLASASPDAEDKNDVTQYYNPMSMKDANALTPQIKLTKMIDSLAPSDVKTKRLIIFSPSFMQNLSTILDHTSRETIQTYLIWKVIQTYASAVEAEETKPYMRFRNELQGKDADSAEERWRTCVKYVDNAYDPDGGLGWILSRFFVERAFSAKAKEFGDQIVSDIKDMFIEKLKAIDWMDKSVVDLAIDKVHQIVQKIGYPTASPDIMDPATLLAYYRSVDISSSFFQNTVSMNKFGVAKGWSILGRPVDRDAWDMTVPTVNAYYNPPGNEIVFPAGVMQLPVFDVDVPRYLSYGSFGSVAGHELSHAFDSTGRHYDQNGNYTDWWTNNTVAQFQKRADCFVDQYGKFSVPGPDDKPLHVNGRLTLGENIADAGGVAAAFAAWKKREAETPDENLPGLEFFTQEQLFFVNYASFWCGKDRKESAINGIYTDPHSPKFARVLGTMANSKDFKDSFKCKQREPVCELW